MDSTGFRPTVTLETYADSARHVDGFHDIDFTPIMTRTAMHWEDISKQTVDALLDVHLFVKLAYGVKSFVYFIPTMILQRKDFVTI